MPNLTIKNFAPDSDSIKILIDLPEGSMTISIWRDGDTFVEVEDADGSEYSYILGKEGEQIKV